MTDTPALTSESEALVREQQSRVSGLPSGVLRDRLAAIEAAAVARHVRETGCEGLDSEMESWLSMEEHAEVEVRLLSYSPAMHVWVRHTRRKPGTRQKYVRTDAYGPTLTAALAQLRAALAPTVAACAREGCGHEERHHRVDPDDIPWCWKDCPCPGYLAPSPATEEVERG